MGNRLEWIDTLKGVAIITVVVGHCVGGALAANYFKNDYLIVKTIFDFIYSFHMPLFFSISGFLFYLTKTYNKYKIRILDLGLIYIFWTLITWLIKFLAGGSINYPVTVQTLLLNLYNPTFIYWYIYSLILISLICSTKKLEQINLTKLLLLFVVAYVVKILPVSLGIFGKSIYFMSFFALGGYLYNEHRYKKISKNTVICLCVVIIFNIFLYFNEISFSNEIEILKEIIVANSAIILSYYIFSEQKKLNVFKILGVYSLHIYLMHDFVVAGTRMIFIRLNNENLLLYLIIGTVLGNVIPIIVGKFCINKPILSYPFTPIKTLQVLLKKHF